MLIYGGAGLLMAGIVIMIFGGQMIKDPSARVKAKKQAPLLAIIGGILLAGGIYLSGSA